MIDLASDATIATSIARLSEQEQDRLRSALSDALTARNTRVILATIRTVLAETAPSRDAIGVLFRTNPNFEDGPRLSCEREVAVQRRHHR